MSTSSSDWEDQWAQLVARAWSDDAFKQRLLADPAAVLKEHGLELPPGFQVDVRENTDEQAHLVLPAKPAPAGLAEEGPRRAVGDGPRPTP
jgi:hypothetical protein